MLTISVLVLGGGWMILVTMIMVVVVVVVLIEGYDAHHLSSGVRRWMDDFGDNDDDGCGGGCSFN